MTTGSMNSLHLITDEYPLRCGGVDDATGDASTDRRNFSTILISLAVVAHILVATHLGFRPFDDTYITFRYARNIATGHGFVYNWGEHVLGTTTPAWTALLALACWLNLRLDTFSLCASMLFDVATASILYRLMIDLEYEATIAAAAAGLFLLLVDYLSLGLSGMETSLFVLLVAATLLCVVERRSLLTGALGALAVLTRPDGAAVAAAVLVTIWLQSETIAERGRRVGLSLASAIIVLLPWLLFSTIYFGSPVPQSVLAKAHSASGPGLRHFSNQNLMQFVTHGQSGGGLLTRTYWQGQFILSLAAAAGAGAILRKAVRGDRIAHERICALLIYPAIFVAGMGAAAAFTWFPWYYASLYPFLAALGVTGASDIAPLGSRGNVHREMAVVGFVALLVICQTIALIKVKLPAANKDFWIEGWKEISLPVPRNARVTVAADEIGVLGWTAWPVTVDDLVGLVSPAALGGSQIEYLRRVAPDYIALRTADSSDLMGSLEAASWFRSEYQRAGEVHRKDYVLFHRVSGPHLVWQQRSP
jgi:hypothetical protein